MPRPYFILVCHPKGGQPEVAFGDFDRAVVAQERRDQTEAWNHKRGTKLTVVQLPDAKQATVESYITSIQA